MKNGERDKLDLKLLERLQKEGSIFWKHPSHEFRAWEMRRDGFVEGEMTIYRYQAGGGVEYRTQYTITDKGRKALRRSTQATAKGEK